MDKELGDICTSTSYNIKVKNKFKVMKLAKEKGFKSVSSFIDKLIEDIQ